MKRAAGKVILVGAGPGDPALLTLRGRQALESCDAVLYDEIVHPDILRWAPAKAARVYVGKRSGFHSVPQDQINRRLASLARSGKTVVRLKGGDPYIFGRGAEEAAHLNQCRISYEVIPGIPSPVGCAAYAGIPLTERNAASRLTFITAHHAESSEKPIPWKALHASSDTLVIFMGMKRLAAVCTQLIQGGFKSDTPAAVVSRGTWPTQTTTVGTLKTLPQIASRRKVEPPALVIVGAVAALKSKLNWYERQPLFGKRIVITRARSQASSFRERLTSLGAQAIELPTIEIHPPSDYSELDRAIQNIPDQDWIVFTSVNGVDYFFERLRKRHRLDARHLSGTKVAAVGEATRERLGLHGIQVDLTPKEYTSDALAKALIRTAPHGSKLLLIRPRVAPPKFADTLKRGGMRVVQATGYETLSPRAEIRRVYRDVIARGADAVVFTSSSTATHLAEALGKREFLNFVQKTKIFSIGPQTSRTLKQLGAKVYRQSAEATISGLIRTLEKAS